MLPILKGVIARRVLLNFRADARVVQPLLPKPFVLETIGGSAIVGICLIRLEHLRPSGMPMQIGISSENMAHRVAVLYPENGAMKPGVFVWRRETNQKLVALFGGRLFPGVNHAAKFDVADDGDSLRMDVRTEDRATDVSFAARATAEWPRASVFADLRESSAFFEHGDCGFSCTLAGTAVEGMQLKIVDWTPAPLDVELGKAAFYFDHARFPEGSVEFDHALIMRGVQHEWHEILEVPQFPLTV